MKKGFNFIIALAAVLIMSTSVGIRTAEAAQALDISGTVSYSLYGNSKSVSGTAYAQYLTNLTNSTSPNLYLTLVLTTQKYNGGNLGGSKIMSRSLGTLNGGDYFQDIRLSGRGSVPSGKKIYIVMTAIDGQGNIYDFHLFSKSYRSLAALQRGLRRAQPEVASSGSRGGHFIG